MTPSRLLAAAIVPLACASAGRADPYPDGRPRATLRMDAVDAGVVLRHGGGPAHCDVHAARKLWVYQDHGVYYMNYDGAGPTGGSPASPPAAT